MLRLLKVRPGEEPVALRLLALMVLLWTGFAIGGNGVESLFLARFGPQFLPYLFAVLGLITFGAMMGATALVARADPRRLHGALHLGMAVVVLASRAALFSDASWIYPVLWLLMMVLWTISTFAGWALASAVSDTRQAKRLFPLYGTGLILGTVAGGLATGPLAALLGAENLLVIWAGSLVGTYVLARSVVRRAPRLGMGGRPGRRAPLRLLDGFHAVRGSSLLRWMAISLLLFALLYFALSFVFATSVTARFPEADELAGFLGLFMGVTNLTAMIVSLLLANRLFARFGVITMVFVLPVVYLAGFAALGVETAFAGVVTFRFVQMVWVNGIWSTGWQALFNVVPAERRDRVRTFMDGVPLQLGIMAAGGLLILAERILRPRDVALIGAAAAAAALIAVWRARRSYAAAVAAALREGNPEVFAVQEEPFGGLRRDAAALGAVVAGTQDLDPAIRRLSVEILAEVGGAASQDAVERALGDPEPEVRVAALRAAARSRRPVAPAALLPLLRAGEHEIRAAASDAAVPDTDPSVLEALRALAGDAVPVVRARAAAALLRFGALEDARPVLEAMAAEPGAEERALAVTAMGAAHGDGLLEPLVAALEDPDPRVCDAATEALVSAGPSAVPALVHALDRPRAEEGALQALARLPGVDPERLRAYARERSVRATRYGRLHVGIGAPDDEASELLAHSLRNRASRLGAIALRAIAPLTDPDLIALALENLDSADAEQRANAIEIVEGVGVTEVVRPLLALWEDGGQAGMERSSALAELLVDDDPWLRACAVTVAGTLSEPDLDRLVDRIAREDPDPLVREAAADARSRDPKGDDAMKTLTTLPIMERVLALRRVPLFRDLAPADLAAVAKAAVENLYADGTTIAEQGEPGDAMHVVVSGAVQVMLDDDEGRREVARRGEGYVVGEMAIVTGDRRMASLIALGDVRTLSIDRRRFQRIIRERPDVALATMRELCFRLQEAHARAPAGT